MTIKLLDKNCERAIKLQWSLWRLCKLKNQNKYYSQHWNIYNLFVWFHYKLILIFKLNFWQNVIEFKVSNVLSDKTSDKAIFLMVKLGLKGPKVKNNLYYH